MMPATNTAVMRSPVAIPPNMSPNTSVYLRQAHTGDVPVLISGRT
jgi:hypothetical protein